MRRRSAARREIEKPWPIRRAPRAKSSGKGPGCPGNARRHALDGIWRADAACHGGDLLAPSRRDFPGGAKLGALDRKHHQAAVCPQNDTLKPKPQHALVVQPGGPGHGNAKPPTRLNRSIGMEGQPPAADVPHMAGTPARIAVAAPADLVAEFCVERETQAFSSLFIGQSAVVCRQGGIPQLPYRQVQPFQYGPEGPRRPLRSDGVARLQCGDHRLQVLTVEGIGRLGRRFARMLQSLLGIAVGRVAAGQSHMHRPLVAITFLV